VIGLIIMVLWFGSGGLGAWLATRHFYRRWGEADGLDFAKGFTVLFGPIGLLGVLFFLTALEGDRP